MAEASAAPRVLADRSDYGGGWVPGSAAVASRPARTAGAEDSVRDALRLEGSLIPRIVLLRNTARRCLLSTTEMRCGSS